MNDRLCVLLIEESADDVALIIQALQQGGYRPTCEQVTTPAALRAAIQRQPWDAVIAGDALLQITVADALTILQASSLDLPLIVITDNPDPQVAAAVMRAGAHDCLTRDQMARLVPIVERELRQTRSCHAYHETEAALRESQTRLRALLDAIPDLIFQFDAEGNYVDVIPARNLQTILGPEELIHRNVRDILPPHVADDRMDCIHRALETGQMQIHEYQLIEKYGVIDYEARIVACGPRQALGIVRDITQQKRSEEERSQLLARIQRQHATLAHIVTHPSLAAGNVDKALPLIARLAADTLDVQRVNIWHLSPNKSEIICLAAWENPPGSYSSGVSLQVDKYPHYFAALEAERVLVVNNVYTEPAVSDMLADYCVPYGIGAMIEAPIRLHGQIVGIVCHEHVGPPRTWQPDQVSFASQVADMVAQVLLNADLHRRAEELAAITRVSREISESPDLDQVLWSIAHQAAQLSRSDGSGVFSYQADGQLTIEVGYGVAESFIAAINERGVPVGIGVIGRAVAERRAVQVADTHTEPGYAFREIADMEHVRSVLAVPMLRNETVIGGIVLWHRQPRHFTPDELTFVQALAQQCVNAVENARLFQAEARRRHEAETLYVATQTLSATLDLPQVFERILSSLRQVVPYDSASVQQVIGNRMRIIGGHGFPNLEELIGATFDLDSGDNPNREVVRTRAPVILEDASSLYGDFQQEPHAQAGIRSWMGVPLLFRDRLIGMITLDKQEPGFYRQEHARLAMAFAAQAAVAVENARLFAEEEQRAGELARSLERQRELDQLKDMFIQNVSHELRMPLALILGHAELLHTGELGELTAMQQNSTAVIARRARMLGKLVSDLTAIVETETKKAHREQVDVAEIVRDLLNEFRISVEQAGLSLSVDILDETAASSPVYVYGDSLSLRRVVDNLLGNALKFTPAGGHIGVRLERREETLLLEVSDTGIGIPPDQLEHIFERFYQVDGGMSRRYGGAGLGLAMVKEVVEAHGGQIAVRSQVGEGSTFTIILPLYS